MIVPPCVGERLARVRMAEAAELLRQLHEEDPWFSYPQAVDLLSALDATEVPVLVAALGDGSAKIRAAVARALGAYDVALTRAALAQALADPMPDVRRAAIGALGDTPDAGTVALLRDLPATDPDHVTRLAAVQVLAASGDPAAVAPLTAFLRGATADDGWALAAVVEALVGAGRAVALEPLLALLDHPEAALSEQALKGLADLGDPAAVPALRAYAAHEPDAYLAAQALLVVGLLRSES